MVVRQTLFCVSYRVESIWLEGIIKEKNSVGVVHTEELLVVVAGWLGGRERERGFTKTLAHAFYIFFSALVVTVSGASHPKPL